MFIEVLPIFYVQLTARQGERFALFRGNVRTNDGKWEIFPGILSGVHFLSIRDSRLFIMHTALYKLVGYWQFNTTAPTLHGTLGHRIAGARPGMANWWTWLILSPDWWYLL